jgi:hypothetical protein
MIVKTVVIVWQQTAIYLSSILEKEWSTHRKFASHTAQFDVLVNGDSLLYIVTDDDATLHKSIPHAHKWPLDSAAQCSSMQVAPSLLLVYPTMKFIPRQLATGPKGWCAATRDIIPSSMHVRHLLNSKAWHEVFPLICYLKQQKGEMPVVSQISIQAKGNHHRNQTEKQKCQPSCHVQICKPLSFLKHSEWYAKKSLLSIIFCSSLNR